MGLADRPYMQPGNAAASRPRFGAVSGWSVTTWLIVLNVAVFVLDRTVFAGQRYPLRIGQFGMWMQPLEYWGHFSTATAISGGQLWRVIGFQFLHANLSHLFGNMLGLWVFGTMIEQYLGSRRYLLFYLLCGLGGPVAYLLFAGAGVLVTYPQTPLVGASAGVYGVLIAAATVGPRTRVQLLFPPVDVELRTLAWVLLGFAVLTLLTGANNAGGEAAHLGGAALGAWLIRRPDALSFADRLPRLPGRGARRGRDVMRYRP